MDNNEREKQPSASVKPDNQWSFKVGRIVVEIGYILSILERKALSLNAARNAKNLVFLVGKTKFPLNKEQINDKLILSWTI